MMLRFFRHIRKTLMEQNRMRTYILYAIGETFLVVIGILIALQVNNWKENRAEREAEQEALAQIAEALSQDLVYMEQLENRSNNLLVSIYEMKLKSYQNEIFVDSLYTRAGGDGRWYLLRTGIIYQLNSGPYETLKNYGLNIVEDDSLRNELVYFYDFMSPRRRSFFDYLQQQYLSQVTVLESLLGEPFLVEVDGDIRIVSKFPPDLLQNPQFLEFLLDAEERAESQLRWVRAHKEDMIMLQELIKQTLQSQ